MFIANWKMNGSKSMVTEWLRQFKLLVDKENQANCVFCPPLCFLSDASTVIRDEGLNIRLGSQNIDPFTKSSLTGGINGSMLSELGCEYVIIGHSERREVFKEKNNMLLDKLKAASLEELKVIFCIGETLSEKESGRTLEVLTNQLQIIQKYSLNKIMIAYEPVWAIGSGRTASIKYIENIHIK